MRAAAAFMSVSMWSRRTSARSSKTASCRSLCRRPQRSSSRRAMSLPSSNGIFNIPQRNFPLRDIFLRRHIENANKSLAEFAVRRRRKNRNSCFPGTCASENTPLRPQVCKQSECMRRSEALPKKCLHFFGPRRGFPAGYLYARIAESKCCAYAGRR